MQILMINFICLTNLLIWRNFPFAPPLNPGYLPPIGPPSPEPLLYHWPLPGRPNLCTSARRLIGRMVFKSWLPIGGCLGAGGRGGAGSKPL
jgi:hypothetical protein